MCPSKPSIVSKTIVISKPELYPRIFNIIGEGAVTTMIRCTVTGYGTNNSNDDSAEATAVAPVNIQNLSLTARSRLLPRKYLPSNNELKPPPPSLALLHLKCHSDINDG